METKIKKQWFGRKKTIEELHKNFKKWHSELEFIHDEIQFLNNLLDANYANCIYSGLHEQTAQLLSKINTEKEIGLTLKDIINNQEATLSDLIDTNSVKSNINFLEMHNNLEDEIETYVEKYKENKMQIFKLIETVLRKKNQKRLV